MATRFIVVSLPRSGTHMLRTLLNKHPDIRTENELFNEHAQPCRRWRRRSVQRVLEEIAWREGPQQIRGCLAHLSQGQTWNLWQYLSGLHDVRYVCMRRYNLLQQYLSLQQAMVHKRWQIYRNEPCPQAMPMHFNPEEVEGYFHQMHGHWDWFEQKFSDPPRLTVWYRELCQNTDEVSRRVQEFLGAAVIGGLQPDTIKIGRPVGELISNFDELRRYFAGSSFESFFTDDGPSRRMSA